jgi:hypothetical protein
MPCEARRSGDVRPPSSLRVTTGTALYAIVTLGLADARTELLVGRLLHCQWPDGGWNCDKDPGADTSSFMETLTPMRGLTAFAHHAGSRAVHSAVARAANVFLDRRLYKRRADGWIIRGEFVALYYPLYWHYDILRPQSAHSWLHRRPPL